MSKARNTRTKKQNEIPESKICQEVSNETNSDTKDESNR